MLRLIVRQARPGMTLARSVVNPQQPGQTLLAAGYRLNAYTIARLHELARTISGSIIPAWNFSMISTHRS